MKYQLIGENDYLINPIETVLKNRGIEDIESFLNVNEANVHDWGLLKNIEEAVECFLKHVKKGSKIYSPTDADMDGVSSNAALINYCKKIFPDLEIIWDMPEGKEHGVNLERVPEDAGLVIITDAGSNQFEEHKTLKEKGIDVIVVDHHECNEESEYAIVVNSQLSPDYPNKQLSGVGMVYKFLKALDDKLNINHADHYLDLVALGNAADVMDLRELETRHYVLKGIKNIKNKFLLQLIEKQSYSMKGVVNITNMLFYIAPLINGMIRSGTMEEKEQMMKSFLESDEIVHYKRGKVDESILVNTARLMGNVKARQDRLRDKGVKLIEERVEEKGLLKNKVLIVNVTDILDSNLTGLVANRLLDKYQRPILFIRKKKDSENFGGSGRGYEKSVIKDFKGFLNETGKFVFCEGHKSAFGVEIEPSKIVEVNNIINEQLKDVDLSESVYDVDFIIPFRQLTPNLVKEMYSYRDNWGGQGVKEPLVAIKGLTVNQEEIKFIGKNEDTLKIFVNGIEYVKFKCSNEKISELSEDGTYTIDVVGRFSINEWEGKITPQIFMDDFEVKEVKEKEWMF